MYYAKKKNTEELTSSSLEKGLGSSLICMSENLS